MNKRNKRIFITGGGSGIGLSIAQSFSKAEYDVTIGGRNEERLKSSGFPYAVVNVADETSTVNAVKEVGPVDILIANAGIAHTKPALKTSLEDWNRLVATNLTGVFLSARSFAPAMVKNKWGRIIVIASTASLRAYPYASAYTASKHGVLGLVKALALELAKTGVTVNAICPGFTDTPMFKASVRNIVEKTGRSTEEAAAALLKDQPMGRLIEPDEIADAALWLASESGRTVNGQAIAIDGGETMR
ncbi:SDR family NAD(P)-dependent oxidoreductase [Hyphococcus flavus]|uniref:SDR family NAD(P)-dependent oxidoreductase n=1 Tax=Hyphococcus flavus TaxID=1866326 RepID=A0AAF0CE42_9PROT|nr:SDR family NAD(P)-dependent oxidoreductase [Hyphococcus flavus]WDI30671.1 SDR family NAD(P)-dependent oxidoreductase [Hyphococcus flavus]